MAIILLVFEYALLLFANYLIYKRKMVAATCIHIVNALLFVVTVAVWFEPDSLVTVLVSVYGLLSLASVLR